MKNTPWTRRALLISYLAIVLTAIWFPKWNSLYTRATISWDISGYYTYLPATFIYQDLAQLEFMDEIIQNYIPTPYLGQAYRHENGNYIMKYPAGQAVLLFPSFLIGHTVALLTDFPADGFSRPYQVAVHFGSILVAFLGLWVLSRFLLQFFDDKTTALSILTIGIGTNYLAYTAIEGAMTHNYLFTLYALLLWVTHRWHQQPTYRRSLAIGALIGLMMLTRPTEVVAVFIPLLWNWRGITRQASFFIKNSPHIILAVVVTALIGSIQLIYWKVYSGHWLEYSYQDQGFSFLNPHVYEVLFTFKKGWLVYTPLMLFAMIGWLPWFKNYRPYFGAAFVYFLFNLWLVSSWDIWWYGGSFGQRALVQSYAVMALPLAAFYAWVQRKTWLRMLLVGPALFAIFLNIFQMYQSQVGILDPENVTRRFYWRIFLKPSIQETDVFLMDIKEDYRNTRWKIHEIARDSFDFLPVSDPKITDKIPCSQPHATFVNEASPFSKTVRAPIPSYADPEIGKLKISAYFFLPEIEWNIWLTPEFTVQFWKGEEMIKHALIRPARIMQQTKWKECWIDTSIPGNQPDEIRVFLHLPRGTVLMYMDDLSIEYYETEP
jgi:MFS family permease